MTEPIMRKVITATVVALSAAAAHAEPFDFEPVAARISLLNLVASVDLPPTSQEHKLNEFTGAFLPIDVIEDIRFPFEVFAPM